MSYFRHPKTANEKRKSQKCPYVRAKRRPKNIPCAWDDMWYPSQRSWKSHRKTQYKVIEKTKKKKSKQFYSPQVHLHDLRCCYLRFDKVTQQWVNCKLCWQTKYIY